MIDTTPVALYNYFVERVRNNLHIIILVSPIGINLKKILLYYPSLTNFCVMDWFTVWPADALQHVAVKYIASMNLAQTKINEIPSKDSNESTSLTKSGDDDGDDQTGNEIKLTDFEAKLVKMAIYFNETAMETNKW